MNKDNKNASKRKYVWIVSVIAAALLCVAGLCAMIFSRRGDNTSLQINDDAESGFYRVLIAGKDRASGLYDVLMLASVDKKDGSLCVMQIPRDTYLEYTDRAYKKINGAPAALGGVGGLKEILSECLGIPLDAYICMDLDTFAKAVDALGGVELELSETFYYNDPSQGLYIHLPKGKNTLDGKSAEQFVRYRSGYVRGDLGRLDAQKIFMSALFEKVTSSLTLPEILKLAAVFLPDLKTDMGIDDIASVASAVMNTDPEKVVFITAPGEDIVSEESGAWYYVLSAQAMDEVLSNYFGGGEGFDADGLFLNENNPNSEKIYRAYSAFSVTSAGKIKREGLEIE